MRFSDIRNSFVDLVLALVSRILVTPLTWIVPRTSTRWVVLGREHGKFLDNAKHFFCWVHQNQQSTHRISFITEHRETLAQLGSRHVDVFRYPHPSSLWALLRAGTIIVDSVDYLDHGRVGFLSGTRLVQLWHGAPLKEIELPLHRRRLAQLGPVKRASLRILKAITGRYRETDFLVSTSDYFTRKAFADCFRARRVISTGYPRNDAMASPIPDLDGLAMANVDAGACVRIQRARAQGKRVVLYSPTFRMDLHSPFRAGGVDLSRWAQEAAEHNYLLVLKLHPLMSGLYDRLESDAVLDVAAESDIYPLLREVDLMVTDYSSIYFDFLLLNRPVVFFAYDLHHYTAQDRHLLFDYDTMTPGPKLASFEDLIAVIPQALEQPKGWEAERSRVRSLVFNDADAHASQRIWDILQDDSNGKIADETRGRS